MRKILLGMGGSAAVAFGCPANAAEFVSVAGSFNSEIGCAGDWQPECSAAQMTKASDGLWYARFALPAGDFEFKITYNKGWDENYGVGGTRDGANFAFSVNQPGSTLYLRHDEMTKLTGFQFSPFSSAVPEPATWAMLLSGFGMLGFAARRRARVMRAAA